MEGKNNRTERAMLWKVIERASYLGCQFAIQIIMARILGPDEYGILAVMLIFVNLANVFVQTGLTSAIVQAKSVEVEECSSVFWVNMFVSILFGVVLFFFAPYIGDYYQLTNFVLPFRIILLILPLSANSAIQISLLSRKMNFRPIMFASFISIVISGTVGIMLAYKGYGIWALVLQQIVFYFINSLLLTIFSRWYPSLYCSIKKIKNLINYGWKILASNIVEVVHNEAVSLAVGKKFSPTTLAYYNRGKQYPQMGVSIIRETLQSVLLSSFSRSQDDRNAITENFRFFMRISLVLVSFMMATLAAAAKPLVIIMLTEQWVPCVKFLQLACIYFTLVPISTIILQAVNAIGRSDIYLRVSIVKRVFSFICVIITVILSDSMIIIAVVWTLTSVSNVILDYLDVRKLFSYKTTELISDTLPYIIIGIFVFGVEICLTIFIKSNLLLIIAQFFVGALVYWVLLVVLRIRGYKELITFIKETIFNKKKINN